MIITTDPVADMLSRIRNALAVGKPTTSVPYSKLKEQIAKVLKDSGYIEAVSSESVGGYQRLIISSNTSGKNPKISHIRRISKPGRRIYAKVGEIPTSLSGRGMIVVSTSRGLMTDAQARSAGIGGELICEVY